MACLRYAGYCLETIQSSKVTISCRSVKYMSGTSTINLLPIPYLSSLETAIALVQLVKCGEQIGIDNIGLHPPKHVVGDVRIKA